MTQTVLLAGATGMLGRQIARHLLDQPNARLRLLVRAGDAAERRAALDPLDEARTAASGVAELVLSIRHHVRIHGASGVCRVKFPGPGAMERWPRPLLR